MTDEYGRMSGDLRALGEIAIAAENFFASSRSEQFAIIRNIYAIATPMIERAAAEGKRVDPYFIDWIRYFTPIEMDAWDSIRCHGVPMYPQFPVLDYFIDFADPIRRIGLETDGKQWHDRDKDRARDARLFEHGWRIFRVTGSEAYRTAPSPAELKERGYEDHRLEGGSREWLYRSVDGVVAAIANFYYRGRPDEFPGLTQTLDLHRLVPFPLDPLCDE